MQHAVVMIWVLSRVIMGWLSFMIVTRAVVAMVLAIA